MLGEWGLGLVPIDHHTFRRINHPFNAWNITTEKTGSIQVDVRRGQANPLLAALKGYQQAIEEGNLLLVTYE